MIEIYDNGGETFDRYTIIINADVYGMSHNPKSPQGFNQYSGTLSELPMARSNGDRVTLESLPEEVQEAIAELENMDQTTITLNVVTCGNCGEPFGHKLGCKELSCPYCRFEDDISSFPDLWYPDGDVQKDSYITITR